MCIIRFGAMIKLGVNTVLFKNYSLDETAAALKKIGYDGFEISAIKGMCEHLDLENWRSQKSEILEICEKYGLELLSSEVASTDPERLKLAFEAAAGIGIPVINIGPGGKSGDRKSTKAALLNLKNLADMAESYGVTLCCKAHVGAAVYNTPTTLRMVKLNEGNEFFGVDMDPSHIHRAGEAPEKALKKVASYMKHIHIRDCTGPGPSPGEPLLQTCGTGEINLPEYFKVLVKSGYSGPVCLEVIGPALDMADACIIAAESYGYMNACLKHLGAR